MWLMCWYDHNQQVGLTGLAPYDASDLWLVVYRKKRCYFTRVGLAWALSTFPVAQTNAQISAFERTDGDKA